MSFYVANGLGDALDDPTDEAMRLFLDAVDTSDEEHGAAWLSNDAEYTLEWGGAVVVSSGPGLDSPIRHIREASREHVLAFSVRCRVHHFESVRNRPCPFRD